MHARKSRKNVTASAPTRTWPSSVAFTATMVVILLVSLMASGCGDEGTTAVSPEPTGPDLTGYWVFAGETDVVPEAMIRVTATDDGYLVEPSSWQGIRWSKASKDGDALVAEATGPGGETYIARLEAVGAMAKLTVSSKEGDGPALAEVDLARPSGDYDDLAVRFEEILASAREAAVKESIHALQVAVQSWMVDHGDKAPPVDEVRPGGKLETYIDQWPANAYTGEPMEPGDAPGDYTYKRLEAGQRFRLTGHFEDGDFTVPETPDIVTPITSPGKARTNLGTVPDEAVAGIEV